MTQTAQITFVGSEHQWRIAAPVLRSLGLDHATAILPDPAVPWGAWPLRAILLPDFETVVGSRQDVVLLAGTLSDRADRLRRLAQTGQTVVCWHPADLTIAFYHEIALAISESNARVHILLPQIFDAGFRDLRDAVRERRHGALQLIQLDVPGACSADRNSFFRIYSVCAELLRQLAGDISEVTTTGELSKGSLIVHHRAGGGALAQVRFEPNDRRIGMHLHVQCEQAASDLSLAHADLDVHATFADPAPSLRLDLSSLPNWRDATHAVELADWALLSLERRRSVDIYHGVHSETAHFKASMTTIGCGLIWFTLFIFLLAAAMHPLGVPGMRYVLAATFGLLIVFLVSQALSRVIPSATDRPATSTDDPSAV